MIGLSSMVKDILAGFVVLCGLALALMGILCVVAAFARARGEDKDAPLAMVVIGWVLTAIIACLLTGWAWRAS